MIKPSRVLGHVMLSLSRNSTTAPFSSSRRDIVVCVGIAGRTDNHRVPPKDKFGDTTRQMHESLPLLRQAYPVFSVYSCSWCSKLRWRVGRKNVFSSSSSCALLVIQGLSGQR